MTAVAPALTTTPPAKPFVKWVGGKRQLLPQILAHVPDRFNAYHEPFLGGGALFFALQPKSASLSDINRELMVCYRTVRDYVDDVILTLREMRYDERTYYEVRARNLGTLDPVEDAARTIYLNKTCFNGLYRVNRRGQFNVSFGRYTNPTICDEANLRACSRALQRVRLSGCNFEWVLECAKAGDFVYLDPPYIPLSQTSSFTSYTADKFGMAEQIRLRDVARDLKSRGVHILLSNSSAPAVFELYKPWRDAA